MTRQYIGARYVPRFMGEYDPSQIYEALDVVDNGLGTSYISKIPTPAGTPLTDTTHWAIYGAQSGAYISLQNQIDTINNTDIPNLQGQINAVVNTDLPAINNTINSLTRKAIYIGNSYAQGVGSSTGNTGIYALTKTIFSDSKLYAGGGVGFLTYTGHSTTFEDLLDDAIADNYFDSLDEVTDIVILSAWGDTLAIKNRGINAGITAMSTAFGSFMTKVKANFPNIKNVYLAFAETRSARTISGTAEGTSKFDEPFNTHWILRTLAPRSGIEYLGWLSWETFMSGAQFTASDDYHPSDLGYTVISTNMKNALEGNYKSAPRSITGSRTFNITTGSTIATYAEITPDETILTLGRLNIAAGNTPTQYANITLMDFSEANARSLVPPMPLGKQMNLHNLDIIPAQALSGNIPILLTLRANSEGSLEFNGVTFKATETLTAVSNAHCLENTYHIVNAM